ncbi:MAG: molecular chaperone Hsp33 [Planctomycetota bacterium]|jgi:molecular chaperone Hsp33
MKQSDQMQRFLFEGHPIRGQHVSLDSSWQTIVEQSEADDDALLMLGQALTAAALLVDTLKIDGSVSLQIRGPGAIHLLVAEATAKNTIRGIIRQSAAIKSGQPLSEIFATDKLTITIQSGKAKPHQGIVPLQGVDLAAALQTYFDQSEQLPTRFWLACNRQSATGMLLQKMPGENADADAWNRVIMLANTTRDDELLELEAAKLLQRLFSEEKLRLFDTDTIRFSCTCSTQRIYDMLFALGQAEVESILREEGEIAVACEFCNASYRFDSVDLAQMFSADDGQTISSTKH